MTYLFGNRIIVVLACVTFVAGSARGAESGASDTLRRVAPAASFTGQVISSDGLPVSGAETLLLDVSADGTPRTIGSTRSGPDGRFAFTQLAESHDRFASVAVRAAGYGLGGGYMWPGAANVVTLGPPGSVEVQFIGPDGKPVEGLRAAPRLLSSGRTDHWVMFVPQEFAADLGRPTDAGGRCTFDGLPRHVIAQLRLDDERFAQLTFQDRVALADAAQSEPVTIHLQAAASLAGRVTFGPSGAPAPGISVLAQATNVSGSAGGGHAVTDEQGRYEIKQLRAAAYNVGLDLKGETARDWTARALEAVPLAAGRHLGGQDMVLVKGSVITGKVVRGDSGAGIPDVSVGVYGPARPESGAWVQTTRTADDGTYLLRVPPGQQLVYYQDVPPTGYDTAPSQRTTVADGQTLTIDIRLPRKPGKGVAGRVVDPDGRPAAGATVLAEEPDGRRWPGNNSVAADAQGHFHFEALPPGTRMRARHDTLATVEATTVNGGEADLTLTLATDARVTLRGAVVDVTGKPIAHARVGLITWSGQSGIGSEPDVADAQGRYELKYLYLDQRYTIEATADGFGRATKDVKLVRGQPNEAPALILRKADRRIAGRVVDAQGRPMAGYRVILTGPDIDFRPVVTNETGRFEFHVVAGATALITTQDPTGKRSRVVRATAGDDDLQIDVSKDQVPR